MIGLFKSGTLARKTRLCALSVFALLGFPIAAQACTPVPYLFELFLSGTPIGAAMLSRNLSMHLGLIAVLLIITFGKAIFLQIESRSVISFPRILRWAIFANFISSLPALAYLFLFAVPMFLVPGTLFMIVAMRRPARCLNTAYLGDTSVGAVIAQIVLGCSFFGTAILLWHAQGALLHGDSMLAYWAWKLGFCLFAVSTGLIITSTIEASVLAYCSELCGSFDNGVLFFQAVLKANSRALLAAFAVLALIALPMRLANPDFLL